jgi:hypothetical protein
MRNDDSVWRTRIADDSSAFSELLSQLSDMIMVMLHNLPAVMLSNEDAELGVTNWTVCRLRIWLPSR